jgi:large subunit ribosomal protein L6
MSRIGKAPIKLPAKTTVTVDAGNVVTVKGPKGELSQPVDPQITIAVEDGVVTLTRANDTKSLRAKHGLYRALLANMVTGVAEGFERRLEIQGVGYRADKAGNGLTLRLGYSHEVPVVPLPGTELDTEGLQVIVVRGCDKQVVGQMAANIRKLRPVEPYKGKGIRYRGERVRRKAGKSAKVGG